MRLQRMPLRTALFALTLMATMPPPSTAVAPEVTATPQPEPRFLAAESRGVPEHYLVTLAEGTARWGKEDASAGPAVAEVAEQLAAFYGGTLGPVWQDALQGFAIELSEAQARKLAEDPLVKRVEQDRILVRLGELPVSCYGFDDEAAGAEAPRLATRVAQAIVCDDPDPRNPGRNCQDNWGLDRIDQIEATRDGIYNYTTTAHSVHVYTIDTGINKDHLEFFELGPPFTRVTGGYNAIPGNTSLPTTDCYRHGTHVAGIIGGEQSGLAKNVWLHPVKFLDTCGPGPSGGTLTTAMAGIDWVTAHHVTVGGPAVVNFSGGNSAGSGPTMAESVGNLLAAGISFVQSAGNQIEDACNRTVGNQPGLGAALIVGGTDTNFLAGQWQDGLWKREGPTTTGNPPDPSYDELCTPSINDCGSNVGACVDVFAPAAHIISADALNLQGTCRLSGTSMAAPHATGVVALYLQANPTATPQQVHDALVGGATCGVLDANPTSTYYIGDGSPNLLLHALLAGGGPAGCNLTLGDTFTGAGSALHGRPAEVGGVAWSARPSAEVGGGQAFDRLAIAGVPFDPNTTDRDPTFAVAAQVNPTLSGWAGVGFANKPTNAYWSAGQVWVLLRPEGTYTALANGTAITLGTGTIPGTPVNGFHSVEVRYRVERNETTVLINGVTVLADLDLGFTPDIQYAGLHLHGAAENGTKIDSFEVRRVSAPAAVLISDGFTGSGALHGRLTDVGGVTWTARSGAVLSGGTVTDGAAIAGLPLALPSFPGLLTLEADVAPAGSEWAGIGFANQPTTAYWSAGQLWVLLRPAGTYTVFANGTAIQLATGTIPGAPISGFHHVELRLDRAANTATVLLNGVTVLTGQPLGFTPAISHAGFHLYRANEAVRLDNFEVVATGAP